MLAGLVRVVDPDDITAVTNTGDDLVLHGLHISPDIDTVTYTLAGMDNRETGWGVAGESWTVMTELERLGGEHWFRLGDRDLATHLYRTERLSRGAPLHEVTAEIARSRGVGVRILPMSDDPVRTRVTLAGSSDHGGGSPDRGGGFLDQGGGSPAAGSEVSFQDYFVRMAHAVAVSGIRFEGADAARPAPGVLDAIASARRIVVCPSNPVVSIGPIVAVPGIRDALVGRRHAVVAVSPIVAGSALKGPADRLLRELGHESSVVGVARLYSPWAGTLVIDRADADLAPAVEETGMACVVTDTVMSTPERAAELAGVVLDATR
jgi:LPPG:FO 2-phospho-L-lactate transferase